MEHKNAERHSGKVYRLFELLGHTEGQLYIAEIAVLITLLIGRDVGKEKVEDKVWNRGRGR